jgi:hypothetical protein
MTIWQSLTYSIRTSNVKPIKEWLHCRTLEAREFSIFLWNRIKERYPASYLTFIIRGQTLSIVRYANHKVVEQVTLDLGDEDKESISNYLLKFPDYPIRLILQGGEADFRLISLKNVKWWDRSSLLKQVKLGEFTSSDWIQKIRIPCEEDPYRYLLMGVRPTGPLRNLISFLSQKGNPIAGFQMWPVLACDEILKLAKEKYPDKDIAKWTLILLCQENQQWQLMVCQSEAVILCRQSLISSSSTNDSEFAKEISATLRYLHRNGYQEGEPVTIIQSGFAEKLNLTSVVHADVLHLPETLQSKDLEMEPFTLWTWLKSWDLNFLPFAFGKNSSFELPELKLQRLAFSLPQLAVQICVPLFILFMLTGFIFSLKAFNQSRHFGILENQLTQNAIPGTDDKKLLSARLFQFYKEKSTPSAIPVLRTLTAPITPEAVATELQWQEINAPSLTYNLKMALSTDVKALEARHKKNKKQTPLESYQQKVEKIITKIYPSAHIEWSPSNQKNVLSISISYR